MSTDPESEIKGECGTCKTPVTTAHPRFRIGKTYYHNMHPCMNEEVLPGLEFKGLCGTCKDPVLGCQNRDKIDDVYYHDRSTYPCDSDSWVECKAAITLAMKSVE